MTVDNQRGRAAAVQIHRICNAMREEEVTQLLQRHAVTVTGLASVHRNDMNRASAVDADSRTRVPTVGKCRAQTRFVMVHGVAFLQQHWVTAHNFASALESG